MNNEQKGRKTICQFDKRYESNFLVFFLIFISCDTSIEFSFFQLFRICF